MTDSLTTPKPATLTEGPWYVFDFDSTLVELEGLEVLAEVALENHPEGRARIERIMHLTEQAMSGRMPFGQALSERLALIEAHRDHLPEAIVRLQARITPSVLRNRAFFEAERARIIVVSSGFTELIEPVVERLGLGPFQVLANRLLFNEEGRITGVDTTHPLSGDQGKVHLLRSMALRGPVYVIGDGYTDLEIRRAGLAEAFFALTENVRRERVVAHADHVAATLDEVLYTLKLPRAVSFPKSRLRVLILEGVHPIAAELFEREGYTIEVRKGALDEDELCEAIGQVSVLCIRSKTQVTARVLEAGKRLLAIGAFCIGTNQIDVAGAARRGVVVFNAPYSNTRSVVELALGEMIVLLRQVPAKSAALHLGHWDKSAQGSREIRGKTLGIVGYGNIGTQLSVLAEAMGMRVLYYDIVDKLALGNAQRADSLASLLSASDIVSLHVDGRRENLQLIGADELAMMKPGALLLNLARGHVVDLEALREALLSGHLSGAAVDVYPYEPKTNDEPFKSPLSGLDNVLITPHVGGSTQEAQESIGRYVPGKLIEYINTGSTYGAVGFPALQLPQLRHAHRFIHTHDNKPGLLAGLNAILATRGINVLGQYLKTHEAVGYVITDVDTAYPADVVEELRALDGTIRFRVLY